MSDSYSERGREHVLSELGFSIALVGEELCGTAEITAPMHVPGTEVLRTSVLAIWVDVLTGVLCIDVFDGRVPVTLDLALDVLGPLPSDGRISAASRTLKVGRSVAAAEVEFRVEGADACFALGSASFVAAPDASLTLPSRAEHLAGFGRTARALTVPLADRAGIARSAPGIATVERRHDGLNASNTINGGLIALVVEEAALSGAEPGTILTSMALRYLRPARVGPILARATRYGEHDRVEARDVGADDRLAVLAMTRSDRPGSMH